MHFLIYMFIETLTRKFTEHSLPKDEWTHEAHLIVALYHIYTYGFIEAVCRLKSGIILLNNFHGTVNSGNRGYHETLTIFWSKIIDTYIQLNKEKSLEELVNDFLSSPLSNRNLPFYFYDKKELMSTELRAVYKEEYKLKISLEMVNDTFGGNTK